MANKGPNKSTYTKELKAGEQLVRCVGRAYLHPSMVEVDIKVADKLAATMRLVSIGADTGEMFYAWIPE